MRTLKDELKETRELRDQYKKKMEEATTLNDGEKNELYSILRNAIERLIMEITLNNKIKEFLTVILRVLGYADEDIALIYQSKEKKKGFLNFFK
jgi:hypothetical protein